MKTFAEARFKIVDKLGPHNLAFVTDMWTFPNILSVFEISASYLDENFEPMDIVLSFKDIKGADTSTNIGDSFMETIAIYVEFSTC